METLKKYWKEFIVVILLFLFIGYVLNDKLRQSEEEKIQNALDQLNTAQKEYLDILQEKQLKLEEDQEKLEDLQSIMASNIKTTTTELKSVKNEKTSLKQKYKVGSVYSPSKLDSLLRVYSKKGS